MCVFIYNTPPPLLLSLYLPYHCSSVIRRSLLPSCGSLARLETVRIFSVSLSLLFLLDEHCIITLAPSPPPPPSVHLSSFLPLRLRHHHHRPLFFSTALQSPFPPSLSVDLTAGCLLFFFSCRPVFFGCVQCRKTLLWTFLKEEEEKEEGDCLFQCQALSVGIAKTARLVG